MRGRISLSFGAVLELAVAGWFGCIPLLAWGAGLVASFSHGESTGWETRLALGIGILAALVVPAVVPVVVLRARDPESHLEWDEAEIREHRGALVRCTIPVSRATAAQLEFTIAGRRAARTVRALQIFDDASGEAITLWEHAPPGAPEVRRRICVESIEPLRAALVQHGVPFNREFDVARAQEPDRVRSGTRITVGRFGYAVATLAVLIAPSYRAAGIALGVAGAGLLALRAGTSVRELRSVMEVRSSDNPTQGDPYRPAPAATPVQVSDIKRGAVIAEVAVRMLFILLALGCPLVVQ